MILRDEDGAEWECEVEMDARRPGYRLVRCRRVDQPQAATRNIAVPADFDLSDPTVQRMLLSRSHMRE